MIVGSLISTDSGTSFSAISANKQTFLVKKTTNCEIVFLFFISFKTYEFSKQLFKFFLILGILKCLFEEPENPEICSESLVPIYVLNKDEFVALDMQKGSKKIVGTSAICDRHYQNFIGQYEEEKTRFLDSCCDPTQENHYRKIHKNLKTVKLDTVISAKKTNIKLVYGDKICKNCGT